MHLESFKSFCDLIIQILIPLILNNLHGLNYFEMQNSFKNKFKKKQNLKIDLSLLLETIEFLLFEFIS